RDGRRENVSDVKGGCGRRRQNRRARELPGDAGHVSEREAIEDHMSMRSIVVCGIVMTLAYGGDARAAGSELADAAMRQNKDAVRSLLQKKADGNAPQADGTTALHWAVRFDDVDTVDALIRAGANVSAANREGATPLQLAALNGNAATIDTLLKAGANANAPL